MRFCSSKCEDIPTDCFDSPLLRFQLSSAGNLHVQMFQQSNEPNGEKTWNPDPDRLLPEPPLCFQQAADYWSTKFVSNDRLTSVTLTDLDSFPIFNARPV